MYRVNAERSQEKNDQNGRMQCCTKVTCATRTRKKSSDIRQNNHATAKQLGASCDGREPLRSLRPSIMRDDFQRRIAGRSACKRCNATRWRNEECKYGAQYGRFE